MDQNRAVKWAKSIVKILVLALVFRAGVVILSLMAFRKPVLGGLRNYDLWYVVMDIAVAATVLGLSEYMKSKRQD